MAYFMLIVDFSYVLQAVMNIIMIFYWIIITHFNFIDFLPFL